MADTAAAPGEPPEKRGFADVFTRLSRERHSASVPVPATTTPRAAHGTGGLAVFPASLGEAAAGAASTSATTDPAEHDEINPARIITWKKENRIASNGETIAVPLAKTVHIGPEGLKIELELAEGRTTSRRRKTDATLAAESPSHDPLRVMQWTLVHVSGATVLASVQDHQPFTGTSTVTDDAFDQSQALETVSALFDTFARHGVKLASVYTDRDNNDGVVRILVNATAEDNAGYMAGSNAYSFGTADGAFHMASCRDILLHEIIHGYVDHIAPGLNADEDGEGKAFHEGIADLGPAFAFKDPNISEDLATYLAQIAKQDPAKTPKALRNLATDAKLDPEVGEEHKRGLVYSGMMWSVKEALAKSIGDDEACDTVMGVLLQTPFFITTRSPSPHDVALAFADGIRAQISDAKGAAEVVGLLEAEARRRNVIGDGENLAPRPQSPSAKAFEEAVAGVKERPLSARALAGIARGLPSMQGHESSGFEVIGDRSCNDLRRVTLRALVMDPTKNAMVPVEDGLLEVVLQGDHVVAADGKALTLPPLELTHREADDKRAVARARELTRQHLQSTSGNDRGLATVLRSFDVLFADENLRSERVVSNGRLCIALRTMAGEFIVDLTRGDVSTRRIAHIDAIRDWG